MKAMLLNIGNSGSGSPLPLETRAAVGAGVLPALNQADAAPNPANLDPANLGPVGAQRSPAYNAFEFVYRQDYGKIILLEQNAETGQEVTQIPTEYHLQQYAAQERAQRSGQQQLLLRGDHHGQGSHGQAARPAAGGTGRAAAVASNGTSNVGPSGAGAPAMAAVPASPPPAQPAAPALAAAAPAHVDIKV
jgi:hypothetical protein